MNAKLTTCLPGATAPGVAVAHDRPNESFAEAANGLAVKPVGAAHE